MTAAALQSVREMQWISQRNTMQEAAATVLKAVNPIFPCFGVLDKKQRNCWTQKYAPAPRSVLAEIAHDNMADALHPSSRLATPEEATGDLRTFGTAINTVDINLTQAHDSVAGQAVVDPTGYLSDLISEHGSDIRSPNAVECDWNVSPLLSPVVQKRSSDVAQQTPDPVHQTTNVVIASFITFLMTNLSLLMLWCVLKLTDFQYDLSYTSSTTCVTVVMILMFTKSND